LARFERRQFVQSVLGVTLQGIREEIEVERLNTPAGEAPLTDADVEIEIKRRFKELPTFSAEDLEMLEDFEDDEMIELTRLAPVREGPKLVKKTIYCRCSMLPVTSPSGQAHTAQTCSDLRWELPLAGKGFCCPLLFLFSLRHSHYLFRIF
jgi:hypothetical protein